MPTDACTKCGFGSASHRRSLFFPSSWVFFLSKVPPTDRGRRRTGTFPENTGPFPQHRAGPHDPRRGRRGQALGRVFHKFYSYVLVSTGPSRCGRVSLRCEETVASSQDQQGARFAKVRGSSGNATVKKINPKGAQALGRARDAGGGRPGDVCGFRRFVVVEKTPNTYTVVSSLPILDH